MKGRFIIRFTTGNLAGRTFSLGRGEMLFIGSDPQCQVLINDDPQVEKRHVCVYYHPTGKILIKALSGTATTLVNGKRLQKVGKLRIGDRVTVGNRVTFCSSWWNALEATQVTIRRLVTRTTSLDGAHELGGSRRGVWLTGLFLAASGLLLFAISRQAGLAPREMASKTLISSAADETARAGAANKAATVSPRPAEARQPRRSVNLEREFVWDEIVNISLRFGETPPSVMDQEFVKAVEDSIRRYTRGDYHKVVLARRAKYQSMVSVILKRHNLPLELSYVIWVESGFNPQAQSDAGAAGLWQLLPGTARDYGLVVGEGTRDERFNPEKSTEAAARYFQSLLKMFGNERYLLALASYNTGQYRVQRRKLAATVRSSRDVDFWHLKGELSQETVDYVPRILAAIIIGRNPDRW